ncbi:TonB-dependent receptor [Limibacter armeniacum]|uniref:SusC/RagA family TonB-linked outer membrane protein n=1 Tax=Limibacter armeniacum TaxID=466084 RepID=UPI002FE5FD23
MKMRATLFALLLSLLSVAAWAQERSISGVIKDATDAPIIGANVLLKGTSIGSVTDLEGAFKLNISESQTDPVLLITFIGYETKEIAVGNQTVFNIVLDEDLAQLEEVVVVGYGVQRKSDLTGAVSSISSKDLQAQPVPDATVLLQGRASGVQVSQNSGAPGAGLSVRVRGTGTVNNSEPLYVVDGMMLSNISHINPSDIESIEVLKDASATAIYGSRGANGVVLVTTKKGSSDQVKVQLELMTGVQSAWKRPDLMNSQDWLNAINTAQTNANTFSNSTSYLPFDLKGASTDPTRTTDWFDEVTRQGVINKANVTVSKGDQNANILMSAGYFKNEGIVKGSDYERINLRLNTNYTISPMFRTGVNVSVSNTQSNNVKSDYYTGIVTNALRLDPLTPVKDPATGEYASTPYSDLGNPVAAVNRDVDVSESLLLLATSYLEFEPIKGLVFRSALSNNLSNSKRKVYLPTYSYIGGENNITNSLDKRTSNFTGWLWENTVNYTKSFGKHNVNVLGGFTAQRDQSEFLSATRNNIPGNNDEVLQYLNSSIDLKSTNAFNSGEDIRMYSYLGRINYSYDDKYFLTASFRQDGSSVFGPGYRTGNFPSFSAGWKLRNESFMDFLSDDMVTQLKLRAGWGRVGNANIDPYGFLSTLQSGESLLEYSYVLNDSEVAGRAPVTLANENIRWETVESTNIGIDAAFLNDRITLTADYFVKNTKDMLVQVPVTYYSGYATNPYINAGEVQNKGFEIDLGYRGEIGTEFSYSVNLNVSSVKNKVIYLGEDEKPIDAGNVAFLNNTTRTAVGEPIGSFYGYQVEGVFQTQEEVDNSIQAGDNVGVGDFKFADTNNDGAFSGDDRTFLGNPTPDFFYGINLGMKYKGFDASFFIQGVQGNEVMNAFKYYNYAAHKHYGLSSDYANHWSESNRTNELFGLNTATNEKNLRYSSFYIEDGSYARLKNMQIGYTFQNPTPWMSNVRVYFSGQNVFTLTKYSGMDPEIGGLGDGANGTLNQGVDYGTYPQARVFSFGANVTF